MNHIVHIFWLVNNGRVWHLGQQFHETPKPCSCPNKYLRESNRDWLIRRWKSKNGIKLGLTTPGKDIPLCQQHALSELVWKPIPHRSGCFLLLPVVFISNNDCTSGSFPPFNNAKLYSISRVGLRTNHAKEPKNSLDPAEGLSTGLKSHWKN